VTSDDAGPRGYAKGRAKRQEIIESATLVFGTAGFNRSSMLEVAERCGLSRAGLLHHFPSKEALLEAVLQWRDSEDRARFRANGAGAPDGLGVLRGMVDLAAHNATIPGLIGLYAVVSAEATAPDHPAHDYFVERYDRIRSGTERALRRAREHGALRPDADPAALAVELTALMDGLQLQWLLNPAAVDMAGQVRGRIQESLTVPLG
jgi:AcrR family transcriptional regulator